MTGYAPSITVPRRSARRLRDARRRIEQQLTMTTCPHCFAPVELVGPAVGLKCPVCSLRLDAARDRPVPAVAETWR